MSLLRSAFTHIAMDEAMPQAGLQADPPPPSNSSSPAQPTMSRLLTLSPPHLESEFWDSAPMRASLQSIDRWAVGFLLVTDALYFRWSLTLHDRDGSGTTITHAALQLSTTLVQLAFVLACRQAYHRWRPTALTINRALRIGILVALAIIARSGQTSTEGINPFTGEPPTTLDDSILSAFRHSILISGSLLAFINVLLPLPWKQQLATQLLHLAPLICLYLPAARVALASIASPAALQQLCQHMSYLPNMLSVAYLGGGASPCTSASQFHCQQGHSASVLLLFMQLYIALFLPVYFTYRYECQHKVAFVRQRWAQQDLARDGFWLEGDLFICVPILDLVMLVLVTAQLWVVAGQVGDLLPYLEVPLVPAVGR